MNRILLDSDVILDLFFDRKPFSDDSAIIFKLCHQNKIGAFVTPVIISNVYYLLRKVSTHAKVKEKLTLLLSFTNILIIDKNTINQALSSNFSDFEDALQNYAAENNKSISAIITRNVKDYQHSKIAVLTPNSYIKSLAL
jgi:predicted nucleic acid-binding protein